jgi:two-component sensor histidine kinase
MLLAPAHRQEHQRLRAAFHQAPAARPMGAGRELHGQRKDKQEIPVEIGLNPMRIEGETFVVASILDISTRRQAEQRMQVVMRELTHRSKNLLAVIQAIARQAAASSPDLQSFHRDFSERLIGLAQSHDILVTRNWEGAPIDDLVRSQLAFLGQTATERISIRGGDLVLAPENAQYLGLALHELATNAVKYGVLSASDGRVEISWRTLGAEDSGRNLSFTWCEVGAPVGPATRSGFGRLVLESIVPAALGGAATPEFAAEGVAWSLDVPLK